MDQEALRRVAIDAAWRSGRLRYKLNTRQCWLPVYDAYHGLAPKEEYILEWGRRTGKTSTMLLLMAEEALKRENAQIGFLAPVREKLTEFIQPIIHDLLIDCPQDKNFKPVYMEKTNHLYFPSTDAKILFVGAQNKSYITLRGFRLAAFAGDEIAFADDMGYAMAQVIRPALFDSQGKAMLGSTPPPSLDHEFIILADEAKAEGRWSHGTIYDAGYPVEWIEKEKRRYLKSGHTEADWRREYMAERVVDASRAIVPEWRDSMAETVPRDEFFQYYQVVCALDLGWTDLTVVLWMYWDFKRAKLVVEDELVIRGTKFTTEYLITAIKAWEAEKLQPRKVSNRVADVNNPLILQDMARLHGMAFNFPSKERLEPMVNELRMLVANGGLAVNPRCKVLIQTLKNGIWDENRQEFERAATTGHADAIAALIYGMRSINRSSNPVPNMYGIDPRTHHIPETATSTDANAFQKGFKLRPGRTPLYGFRRNRAW